MEDVGKGFLGAQLEDDGYVLMCGQVEDDGHVMMDMMMDMHNVWTVGR